MARITSQKTGALNEADRLQLGTLLLKAGYQVRLGRQRPPGNKGTTYTQFVEYEEVKGND